MTGKNENTGELSVGIQDGKGAASSNPHVSAEAKPGRITIETIHMDQKAEAWSDSADFWSSNDDCLEHVG